MSRLNVLFVTPWYPTKEQPVAGVFVREHAKAVQLYDNVAVLHCAGENLTLQKKWYFEQEKDESLTENITTYRVWYKRSSIPKTSFFVYLWSIYKAFYKILKQGFRPDIIHANIYFTGIPAVLIGKFYRIPVVISEHFTAFPRKLLLKTEVWKAKIVFYHAKYVLPVSLFLQKAIQEYGIIARFKVVPPTVDIKLFFTRFSRFENRNHKRLLFVGLLDSSHKKGIPYLLQALTELRRQRSDWHLDVVGDGPAKVEYECLATKLGIIDKVTFHGLKPKKRVAIFMSQADLFVLPSLWENLPSVIIEAMASGLPIVSTSTGGIPEIVSDDVGILVPPGDAIQLSKAINKMLDINKFDRFEIAQKSLKYSKESIGKLIHSIYINCVIK